MVLPFPVVRGLAPSPPSLKEKARNGKEFEGGDKGTEREGLNLPQQDFPFSHRPNDRMRDRYITKGGRECKCSCTLGLREGGCPIFAVDVCYKIATLF
jgi:hypothetical protein